MQNKETISKCYEMLQKENILSDDKDVFKQNYKKFVLKNHPDKGGDVRLISLVNNCRDIYNNIGFEKLETIGTTTPLEEKFKKKKCTYGHSGWKLTQLKLFCNELNISYNTSDDKLSLCDKISRTFTKNRNDYKEKYNKPERDRKEKLKREELEKEKLKKHKNLKQALDKEKARFERQKLMIEKQKLEKQRLEKQKLEKEKQDKQRLEKEKQDKYDNMKRFQDYRDINSSWDTESETESNIEIDNNRESWSPTPYNIKRNTDQELNLNLPIKLNNKRYFDGEDREINKKLKLEHIYKNKTLYERLNEISYLY